MSAITVRGATLAGMAVAARLAKAGHRVTLVPEHPGRSDAAGLPVVNDEDPERLTITEELPELIAFPAPWRDLFKKSGRTLEAELARRGLELRNRPTRPVAGLELPTERGEQFRYLSAGFGEPIAERWRDLLDALDEVWQARRPLGLEQEFDPELFRRHRRALWWGHDLAALARSIQTPELARVIEAYASPDPANPTLDPRRTPASDAVWLSVERTFGVWQVTDTEGTPQPAGILVELLTERLRTRGVTVSATAPGDADAEVVAFGRPPRGLRGPRPWPRRTGSRLAPGRYTCGDHTHAGPTVTGRLLSAALAAYAVHLDLTGENIHPTNKDLNRRRPPAGGGRTRGPSPRSGAVGDQSQDGPGTPEAPIRKPGPATSSEA